MTLQDLKAFLRGIASSGIAQPQLDATISAAIEAGYASVWGKYNWSVKRASSLKTTVASQAYTDLPPDFESLVTLSYLGTSDPRPINVMNEMAFDYSYPNPAAENSRKPIAAKITFFSPQNNNWRLYWFPIPDGAYSMQVVYNRRPDSSMLPALPSWMLDAVIAKCSAIMQPDGEKRQMYDQVAEKAIQNAIFADRPQGGLTPQYGVDPGWDDGFDNGGNTAFSPFWAT